jgi:CAAX prenyl protease-like protein
MLGFFRNNPRTHPMSFLVPGSRAPGAGRLRDALPRAAPFLLFIAALALRQALAPAAHFDIRWLYLPQAVLAGIALWVLRDRYHELANRPPARHALLAVVAGIAVFLVWVAPVPAWSHLGMAGDPGFDAADGPALRWDFIVVRALSATLIVPLIEELFWRSLVMRWIDRRDFLALVPSRGSLFALLASSAVFSLEHDLWAAALFAGLVYGQLFRWSGSLWVAVIAHGSTNLALAIWVVAGRHWEFW